MRRRLHGSAPTSVHGHSCECDFHNYAHITKTTIHPRLECRNALQIGNADPCILPRQLVIVARNALEKLNRECELEETTQAQAASAYKTLSERHAKKRKAS